MNTPAGTPPTTPPAPNAGEPASTPLILIVDDDLLNQRVLTNLLKRKQLASTTARSGKECLDKTSNQHFDLILLDIQMPEMDGFATAQHLRDREAQQNLPRIPIVALTALREAHTRERCLECGMDDHLTKPVNTEALFSTIQRLLNLPPA
jgi:two-component system sensor histidine kinase/response regulator